VPSKEKKHIILIFSVCVSQSTETGLNQACLRETLTGKVEGFSNPIKIILKMVRGIRSKVLRPTHF